MEKRERVGRFLKHKVAPYIRMHRTHLRSLSHTVDDLFKRYMMELQKEFHEMYPYLPPKITSILDIGCGLAGIDIFLCHTYPGAKLYLLDSNGDEWGSGWNDKMEPFMSREITEELLLAYDVTVDRWYDVGTKEVLKADLVISQLSCGFHYPLDTYKVKGDKMIADLRINKEAPRGQIIKTTSKYNRCIFDIDK